MMSERTLEEVIRASRAQNLQYQLASESAAAGHRGAYHQSISRPLTSSSLLFNLPSLDSYSSFVRRGLLDDVTRERILEQHILREQLRLQQQLQQEERQGLYRALSAAVHSSNLSAPSQQQEQILASQVSQNYLEIRNNSSSRQLGATLPSHASSPQPTSPEAYKSKRHKPERTRKEKSVTRHQDLHSADPTHAPSPVGKAASIPNFRPTASIPSPKNGTAFPSPKSIPRNSPSSRLTKKIPIKFNTPIAQKRKPPTSKHANKKKAPVVLVPPPAPEQKYKLDKKPTRVIPRYSWKELGLGTRWGAKAYNKFQKAENQLLGRESPLAEITALEFAKKLEMTRPISLYLPPNTPLQEFVENKDLDETETASGSATDGNKKNVSSESEKKKPKKSETASNLRGKVEYQGPKLDYSLVLHHALGRLYHTMCRQDADEDGRDKRSSYNWNPYDVQARLQSFEGEMTGLKKREEQIVRESKLLGNTDVGVIEEAYRLLGEVAPHGC